MKQNRRLIDSDVAFRFFRDQKVQETGAFSKGVNKGLNIAKSAIHNPDAIPSVDAVEVVRCRDCRHYKELGICSIHSSEPDPFNTGYDVYMESDAFCSYGERRNNSLTYAKPVPVIVGQP